MATQFSAELWGLRTAYLEALAHAGLSPVLLPPQDPKRLERILPHLDGLLLPGGVDLDPALYHEEPHPALGEVQAERDQLELFLIKYAVENGLPILGICRGIQAMNVALGGSLYQDLSSFGFREVQHQQKGRGLAHSLTQVGESPLGRLFPETFRVNSYHHQGLKRLAPGLKAVALAPDGLVEAVILEGHPLFLGLQWHPELLKEHWGIFRLYSQV